MALSIWKWLNLFCLTMAFSSYCAAESSKPVSKFESARSCAHCHEVQHREWEGSMMHYSAQSPVFQAFEVKARKLTDRFGPHDKQATTFCINCHSPQSAYGNEMIGLLREESSIHQMGSVAREGITCTFCHSVQRAGGRENLDKGLRKNSPANADLIYFPTTKLVGPTETSAFIEPGSYHAEGFSKQKSSSQFLKSSEFCGSCHNVNIPKTADSVLGTPFQIEQGTFTEWQQSDYASEKNRFKKVVSCVDCHMSLYGTSDPLTKAAYLPGEFPQMKAAKDGKQKRKHALHRFTSASVSLLEDDSDFPNQDTPKLDAFGFPLGQKQLRESMLKKACTLSVQASVAEPEDRLTLQATVTNTGAGHHVPTGLSQERELWLEVRALVEGAEPFFTSGFLKGGDLQEVDLKIDPATMLVRKSSLASDFGLRPFAASGLAKFSNAFMKKRAEADYEHVVFFSHADHIDNTRSLPVLKPVSISYDIPLSSLRAQHPGFCGDLSLEVRLLYRSFRPKLLQALELSEPDLLTVDRIKRNTVVEMSREQVKISVCLGGKGRSVSPRLSVENQTYRFERNERNWIGHYAPALWEDAVKACEQDACVLPTIKEYDSLKLGDYVPLPGDNQDELWKARWTIEVNKDRASTYTFGWKDKRVQTRKVGLGSLERLPFFCLCSGFDRGGGQ